MILNVLDRIKSTLDETDIPNDLVLKECDLDLLPLSIYMKDQHGLYLAQNQFAKIDMIENGFITKLNTHHVLGKADDEMFDIECSRVYRKHDRQVIQSQTPQQFIEDLVLPNGQIIQQLSIKTPFQMKGHAIGILGCTASLAFLPQLNPVSCDKSVNHFKYLLMTFMGKPILSSLADIVDLLRSFAINRTNPIELKQLLFISKRELECMCLLLRNFSAKQIASLLEISHRTVEDYLQSVKNKLNLYNKNDIIAWLWDLLYRL